MNSVTLRIVALRPDEEIIPGMKEAIERRRLELGLTLGDLEEASGLTRQGLAPVRNGYRRAYQDSTRLGIAKALRWPNDALDRLMRGEDPATFTAPDREPIQLDASGGDLEELRLADPAAYELVMTMARAALEKVRERREREG